MKKYRVEVQKVVDGYMEFYADPDDEYLDILDYARTDLDDDESLFVAEAVTFEVGRFELPVLVDEDENSELWK